jgi:hypothetical protein
MLRSALTSLGLQWSETLEGSFPKYGMVRILWNGPWSDEGLIARFMRSHWIATYRDKNQLWVFDINAISVGGWMSFEEWETQCAPYIVRYVAGAYGDWSAWERFEIINCPLEKKKSLNIR